jgi:hypothetical protein
MNRRCLLSLGMCSLFLLLPFRTYALAEWTIMVFMNGKNSLDGSLVQNFLQLASVQQSSHVNVVVELGRPETSSNTAKSSTWGGVRRYKISKGMDVASDPLVDLGSTGPSTDMGTPQTLQEFVQWSIDNFAAKHYALIIASHGQGYRLQLQSTLASGPRIGPSISSFLAPPETGGFRSASQDDNSHHTLFNRDIQNVLETFASKGNKIDVIGFDACSMAMIETAYAMRHSANFMVASEELIPDRGWDYSGSLSRFVAKVDADIASHSTSTDQPRALGDFIVATYKVQEGEQSPRTLSVVDLSRVDQLAGQVATLATALEAHWDVNGPAIIRARKSVKWLGMPTKPNIAVDFPFFLTRLWQESGDQALKALALQVRATTRSMILSSYASDAEENENLGGEGLSIYLPTTPGDFLRDPDHSGYVRGNTRATVEFVESNEWSALVAKLVQ